MSEQNKTLVRRLVEEVYNQGNLAVADELAVSDLIVHQTTQEIRGREGAKQYVAALRAAFPDLHMTIEDQIAEGDRVVIRWTARGTHNGELQGILPTGKKVRLAGTDIERIVDGKLVECWSHVDELGMMQQLGAIPAA
jgi:steroid delta-isomerase-like uncharacterized protein